MRRLLTCAGLALALALQHVEALPKEKDRWIEARTENFVLYSNARESLTRNIGLNLERLRRALGKLSGDLTVSSPLPTYIYVLRGGAFHDYVGRGGPYGSTVGMFVSHRDGNYVAVNAARDVDPYEVIFHEYLHYYLHNNTTAAIPVWFDEGVAEFYSTFTVHENQVDIGRPVQRHMAWLRANPTLPLERLFAVGRDSPEYNEADKNGVFYAQSWAVVHILFGGQPDRWPRLLLFLELLEDGRPPEQALGDALGTTLDSLARDLASLIRSTELPYTRYTFKDLGINEQVTVRTLSQEETLFRLGDYLAHAAPERAGEAEEHFRAALKIAPEHAGAIAGLGFLRELGDDLEEAARFYTWAIELDGDNYLTHFLLAQNLVESYYRRSRPQIDPHAPLPRELARARELYRESIMLNPGLAAAYAGVGYTYLFDPSDPAPGIEAMEVAHSLMPHDEDVAYGLLLLHLKNGDREAAERLERRLRRADDPATVALARQALLTHDLDEANRAIAEDRLAEGLALIRGVLAETTDPALARDLEQQVAEIEAVIEKNRLISLYNDALTLVRQGHLSRAEENLRTVLAEATDPELIESAAALRRIIDEQRIGP